MKLALRITSVLLLFARPCLGQTLVDRTYVMRVETTVFEVMAGMEHTCMLVYPDGRFRKEKTFQHLNGDNPNTRVYLDKLSDADSKTLETILNDDQFQRITTAPFRSRVVKDLDALFITVPRLNGVQDINFQNAAERRPFSKTLKPIVRFISNLDGRRVAFAKDEAPNGCEAPRIIYRSTTAPASNPSTPDKQHPQ
jgi:hypothetical protein